MDIKELENKIINADCMDILRQLPDKCIDLVLTDPPYLYNESDNGGGGMLERRKYTQEIITKLGGEKGLDKGIDIKNILTILKNKFKKGFNGVFFCNQNQLLDYILFAKENDYRFNVCVWHKLNPAPLCNNKYLDDIEFIVNIKSNDYLIMGDYNTKSRVFESSVNKKDKELYNHPTIKPEKLVKKFLINHSNENDLVLDCFSGSGTTAIACHKLKRRFICIEKDKEYYEASVKRLEEEQRQLDMF